MCQSNMNKSIMLALLGALIVAVVFISGCTQMPEEKSGEGQPSETTTPVEKSTIALPESTTTGKIAFTSGGSVYVINYDGTGKVKLDEGYLPLGSWSPDGKMIIYGKSELVRELYSYQERVPHFYVINYDGTGKTDLGRGGDPPKWSPVGKIINPSDIKINEEYVKYVLSPDGKKIAYINKYYNLIVVNTDGTNKIRLVPVEGEVSIMWSPDGKKIVYGGVDEGYKLINIDGTGKIGLASSSFLDSRRGHGAIWSPDGKMIAYIEGSGESWQSAVYSLAVVPADNPRNVVARATLLPQYFGQYFGWDFSWSSDGKRILYHALGMKNVGYYVLDVGTGNVTYIGDVVQPEWSPDGKKHVYTSSNNIYVINADGTGRINIGEGEKPKWMADGKKIVYHYNEKFGKEVVGEYIYVVNADGTGKIKLTEGQNPIPSPATK